MVLAAASVLPLLPPATKLTWRRRALPPLVPQLCDALQGNTTVISLDLSANHLTDEGARSGSCGVLLAGAAVLLAATALQLVGLAAR